MSKLSADVLREGISGELLNLCLTSLHLCRMQRLYASLLTVASALQQ